MGSSGAAAEGDRAGVVLICCPLCGSGLAAWRSIVNGDGTWRIDRCRSCRYAFVNPRPDRAYLARFYASQGHPRPITLAQAITAERAFPNSTLDAASFCDDFLRHLTPQSRTRPRLLDVGCGYGFFSREAQRRGFAVTVVEMATQEAGIAREMLGIEPLRDAFEDVALAEGSFDAVLMSQTLEHAGDPLEWVRKAERLLAPGGLLAVAVPNFSSLSRALLGRRDPFITPPAHLNYFSVGNLTGMLRRSGFAPLERRTISRLPDSAKRRLARGAWRLVPWRLMLGTLDTIGAGTFLQVVARRAA